jgi:hypothetical protein
MLFWSQAPPSRHSSKRCCIVANIVLLLSLASISAVYAATYYVGPTGSEKLSQDFDSPGSLNYALAGTGNGAGAPTRGDVVVIESGVYDVSSKGIVVYNSGVTFQSHIWHGAVIKNSTGSALVSPSNPDVVDVTWQGVVFGPCATDGWSGGGSMNWKFLNCEFVRQGGVGAGSHSLFERDLFTDSYSNAFDIGGNEDHPNTGVIFKDCIARRGNRLSADDDGVGNKEDFVRDMVYDDFVAYDNNGSTLWFDTDCDTWLIKNSTFFANHGGNNWYTCGVGNGISTTQFTGFGQDGQGLSVGQSLWSRSGVAANVGSKSVVVAVSGNNPQTITVSPAFPSVPGSGDQFLVSQNSPSTGDGFTTEANDCGVFTDNVCYSNTDRGFYDHASGGTRFGVAGGIVVTDNLFAYNGEGYTYWPDGRDDGPAVVKHNQFLFKPGSSKAFGSGGGTLGQYPGPLDVVFDYNIYDAENSHGNWADWYAGSPPVIAGGLTNGSQPAGQDYLQDPATLNQDLHSVSAKVPFWGTPPATHIWPLGTDTNWKDIYAPNNTFSLKNSIHQIDDTDGAVTNTIDGALVGHQAGDVTILPVSAHTPLVDGTCEVYDLNGRWMPINVTPSDQADFLKSVPPYVTCGRGNRTVTYKIRVVLSSVDAYSPSATYTQMNGSAAPAPVLLASVPGSKQTTLVWKPSTGAQTYSVYRGTRKNDEDSTPVTTGVNCTSFTDNGLTDGTTYYYKVEAVNSYGTSASSNELSATPSLVTAILTGTSKTAYNSVLDLTKMGTVDWRQWGDLVPTNHRASGGGLITDVTVFGSGKTGRWSPAGAKVVWTDSASSLSNDDDEDFAWCNQATNCGWTFTVPADTTKRTLTILWGGAPGAVIKLDAHLSDASAPDYVDALAIPQLGETTQTVNAGMFAGRREAADAPTPGLSARLIDTITYNAAKPGQVLTITLTLTGANNDANPSLDLMAACLH